MHVNLLGHVEVPEMYNADKVHKEKMPCGLENSWKAFKGDFFEVMKKKLFWFHLKFNLAYIYWVSTTQKVVCKITAKYRLYKLK